MECETSHICHTSRKTNHFYLIAPFYTMQNVMLTLSQDRLKKAAQESLLLVTTLSLSTSLSLFLSLSLSLALLSQSLALALSLCSLSQFLLLLSLSVSLPVSFC